MKKVFFAVNAAIFGVIAVQAFLRSHSVSTTKNADSKPLVQPEPVATEHVIGSASPADVSAEKSPRGVRYRRCRKGHFPLMLNSTSVSEGVIIPVRGVTTSPVDSAETSPLEGKENGTWKLPRIIETAIILLRGEGMSHNQIGKAVGLSGRAVSRYLRGVSPYPCQRDVYPLAA